MQHDQKIALVTGGSRGIGAAICQALAGVGYAVLVNYRSNEAAAQQVLQSIRQQGGEAASVQADISDERDRQRLVSEAFAWKGGLHLLVNNAGIAPAVRADILDITEADYRHVLEVNLHGTFFLSQAVAKRMLAEQAPEAVRAIVNISSVSAEIVSTNRAAYCIAKAGLAMATKLFADRLAGHGINVFEIRPGVIETDMTSGVKEKYDKLIAGGLSPIRRWGQPQDVAAAVAAIATGHFPFSTGQVFYVDGGMHIQRL